MQTCPYCGKEALSKWYKSMLGPARNINCKSCGKPVTVPFKQAMIAIIPVGLGIILNKYIAGAFLLGIIITFIVYVQWVPLIPYKRKDKKIDTNRPLQKSKINA